MGELHRHSAPLQSVPALRLDDTQNATLLASVLLNPIRVPRHSREPAPV
jgi:hypothetical protein